jgi:predicted transposase YbfD/YdcC
MRKEFAMSFLERIEQLADPRIPGMVHYPLAEVLLTVLVGVLCRADDFDEIEDICTAQTDWLRRFLPFAHGVAPAQTLRRILARLAPRPLEAAFAAWARDLAECVRGVLSVDGKSVRASKWDGDGTGALHLVSAYAHEAGLVLAQQAVDKKSNEITAIPDLLDMLDLHGCIVTIDAMGTQKEIAAKIIAGKGDYVLALKGNQGTLHTDVTLFFADPVLVLDCPCYRQASAGHGRIEERSVRVAEANWLVERHPEWKGLKSIASVTTRRTIKKSGMTSNETRFYISSLPPDPVQVAAAVRAHWSIENNVHWVLDVAFREDESRTRKDHSARNLAMFRRAVLNLLRRDPTRLSLKRKRLKACIDPAFRQAAIAR